MSRILAIARKDLLLLVRDRAGLFFTVFFPIIFAVFFGVVFSGSGGESAGIDVVLVDEDSSDVSKLFVEKLAKAPELSVALEKQDGAERRPFTREEAADLVRKGRRAAYIIIPRGYGGENAALFWAADQPALLLGVDPSRSAEAGMLEGIITRYAFERLSNIMADPAATRDEIGRARALLDKAQGIDPQQRLLFGGMFASIDSLMADMAKRTPSDPEASASGSTTASAFNPIRIERSDVAVARSGPKNAFAVTFAQGIMWGVAGCAASFGISFITERTRGTLVRLRTAPLAWTHVLLGKTLACFAATIGVALMLLLIARLAFGVIPVSIPMLTLAIVSLATCFVGIMMMLAVIGRTEASAGSIGWAVILVMMMIGGATIPVFSMPKWMQQASGISPVRWGILAVEGGLWRGFTTAEMMLPCAILLGVGVVCFALGVRLFRWAES